MVGNFWDRITVLFRRLAPQTVWGPAGPQQRQPTKPGPQAPVAPQVPQPQMGAMTVGEKMNLIHQAGRGLRVLFVKYDGMSREVEPYSFRQKTTGLLFYGFCSIHGRIHSFKVEKIEEIQMLDKTFAPKWEVEM